MPHKALRPIGIFLLSGSGALILGLILASPIHEKVAIVGSTLGIISIFSAAYLLGFGKPRQTFAIAPSWLRCLLLIAVGAACLFGVLGLLTISIVSFAIALLFLFLLAETDESSNTSVPMLAVLVVALIAYSALLYYPLNIGVDPLGYLSVASTISQTGRYTHIAGTYSEEGSYYSPFPIMAMVPSVVSAITGLPLLQSLAIFPGILVLLQPLLVFMLSLRVFGGSRRIAALSAFIVTTESAVIQYANGPLAISVAISLLLMVMLVFLKGAPRKSTTILSLGLFLTLVIVHGGVGLVATAIISYLILLQRRSYGRILTFNSIYLGYLTVTTAMSAIVGGLQISLQLILQFIFAPSIPTAPESFPVTNGLIFIWWGLPPALAFMSIFILRDPKARFWALIGLTILGLSFIVNIVAPTTVADRYLGLVAWFILALAGGSTIHVLTRARSQLILVVPLIILVGLSAVVNPYLSPQYGYGHGAFGNVSPTTASDRVALDWLQVHARQGIAGDLYSMSFLTLARFESGTFSTGYINSFTDYSNLFRIQPGDGSVMFIRWTDAAPSYTGTPDCIGLASTPSMRNSTLASNIVYSSSCDMVVEGN